VPSDQQFSTAAVPEDVWISTLLPNE